MGKRLENICENLMELFQKNKRIDEEQVHIFFEGAADCLNERTNEDKTVKLDKLTTYLQKKWQYREIEGMTSEQAFLCGSIWGVTKLLGMKRERKEQAFRLEELKRQYSGHYDFLHAIAVSPGIKHKDLAEECGKSVSLLSQFAVGVKRDGLITCSRIGREKYYYLRPLGEQVHEELRKEKLERQKILMQLQEKRNREGTFRQWWNICEMPNSSYERRYTVKKDVMEIVTENSNYGNSERMSGLAGEDIYESMVGI